MAGHLDTAGGTVPQYAVMAHPLAAYLDKHGLTQEAFADKAGLDRTVVTKVLGGKRKRFSVEAAKKIAKATHGAVSFEAALGVNSGHRPKAA